MDFIRIIPSASLLSVLAELHTCPGAPKSIKQFFHNKINSGLVKSKKEVSTSSRKKTSLDTDEENSDKFTRGEKPSTIETAADDSCKSLLLLTSDVKWCHAKLRERGMPQRIHQLLNDSEIVFPKYEAPPRNPELEARIQKLKANQENKEYQRMTESITQLKKGFATTVGNEYRELHQEMMKHIITGIQYLLSVVGTFYGIFMAVSLATPDFSLRVVCGICAAVVVAIAEIYFIIRDDMRSEYTNKTK